MPARITWTAPTDGGSAVTNYDLEKNGNADFADITPPATTYLDMNAVSGDLYRVRAVNSVGAGAWSETGTYSPAAATWEAAVATRDYAQVEAWYAANTGHEAAGYTDATLTPGSLTSTADGQVFEGIVGGAIVVEHNNVTYRGCKITGSSTYGARYNPTSGSSFSGTVIENCTFDGGEQDKAAVHFNPGTASANNVIVRNCNIYGWTSGNLIRRGMLMEYCWIHDLGNASVDGPHVTSGSIRGPNSTIRRCYGTGGGSAIFTIYFDTMAMQNVALTENILDGSDPQNNPSYLVTLKDDPNGIWDTGATGVTITGNYLGGGFQFGIFQGAPVPWGSGGNSRSGNQMFADGTPVIND